MVSARGMAVLIVFCVIIGGTCLFTAIRQIDAGTEGVVDFFGTVSDKPLTQGINLVKPLSHVTSFILKTQEYEYKNIENTLTSEGLNVIPDVSLIYRIKPGASPMLYQEVQGSYFDTLVTPIFMSTLRDEIKRWTAEAIYTGKASIIQADVEERLRNDTRLLSRGIIIDSVLIRGVKLPDQVVLSIEAKIKESQAVDQMKFSVLKQEQENLKILSAAKAQAQANQVLAASITPTLVNMEYVKAIRDNPNAVIVGGGSGLMIDGSQLLKNV